MKSLNIDRLDDDAEIAGDLFPFGQGDIVWIEGDENHDDARASAVVSPVDNDSGSKGRPENSDQKETNRSLKII